MPSTEPQAREKRSIQSDIMSDFEKMDVMLASLPENGDVNEPQNNQVEVGSVSTGLQEHTYSIGEHFRSLLNSTRE